MRAGPPARPDPSASRLQRGGALRVHLCLEATGGSRPASFLRSMDIVATFERSSNVPLLYMPGDLSLYPPLPHAPPGGSDAWAARRLVMVAVSHCGLRRDVLLRQIMLQ
jgi:hypothetical protein